MSPSSDQWVANTRGKLRLLEASFEEACGDTEGDPHLRELEKESLQRLINQLKEEITRYEVHQPPRR